MGTFVFLRARTHRLLLVAALLTVVLATSVLASLTAFTSAVGDAGLRRALEHPSAELAGRTLVQVQSPVGPRDAAEKDRAVREELAALFPGMPVETVSATHSGRFVLPEGTAPEQPAGADAEATAFTVLATLERSRAELVDGAWPKAPAEPGATGRPGPPLQAALPERAAELLGLRVGETLALRTSAEGGTALRVQLTGVYRAADARDPYWRLDPLEGAGSRTLSFTTYGPLVVDPAAFAGGAVEPSETRWQADADFSGLRADQVAELRQRVAAAVTDFEVSGAEVSTELATLLGSLESSLLVTRSTLLIGTLQLVLLAGLALLLVAQLLAAERAEESELLRARGASRLRLAGLAGAESLLLVLPAALLAPLTVTPVVGWLTGSGPLAEAGVEFPAQRTAAVWWVAAGTALVCALAIALPALRRPAVRGRRRAALLRGGADVALVVLAAVAYTQLLGRTDGGVITGGDGGPAIDPVLVAAPALALLAGTVLALRLLPLLATLAERRAARSRSLVGPLAGWQLSRRPERGAAPAMLLVLAVAMGVFSLGQGASWERSQQDQADFATGAEVQVTGSSSPQFGQGGVYDGIEGVRRAVPVARDVFDAAQGRRAQLLATDTRYADEVLRIRPDLADRALSAQLASEHHKPVGAEPRVADGVWEFTARLDATDAAGRPVADTGDLGLSAVLQDRHGVPYRFAIGRVAADGKTRTLRLDLTERAGVGAYAGPLRLVRFDAQSVVPTDEAFRHRLVLGGLDGVEDQPWQGRLTTSDRQLTATGREGTEPALLRTAAGGRELRVEYHSGMAVDTSDQYLGTAAENTVTVALRAPKRNPAVLVTDAYLAASGAEVGDRVKIAAGGTEVTVRIAGSVRALPTATDAGSGDGGGAVLVDLAALDRALEQLGSRPVDIGGWWLATEEGAAAKVAEELRNRQDLDSVQVREEVAEQLRSDPLGAGPRTALTASAAAAALLAATGFAAAVAGAVRERAREFAVLRALGASRRRLARVIATEHAVLVAVSLAVGTALGALLLRMVLPLIVLAADAQPPEPPLLIELPLGSLGLLLAAVAVVPMLSVLVIALRRGETGTADRRQGDR